MSDYDRSFNGIMKTAKEEYDESSSIKPKCKLIGQDGNVFNLIGIASKALKAANQFDNASKMVNEVFDARSYSEALSIIQKYVEVE